MGHDEDYMDEEMISGEFSLESILAEYKGSAFINGEKKTPKDKLNEQADKILKEAAIDPQPLKEQLDGNTIRLHPIVEKQKATHEADSTETSDDNVQRQSGLPESFLQNVQAEDIEELDATKVLQDPKKSQREPGKVQSEPKRMQPKHRREQARPKKIRPESPKRPLAATQTKIGDEKDSAVTFFDNYRSEETDQDTIIRDVQKAIEKELGTTESIDVFDESDYTPQQYGFGDEVTDEDSEFEEPNLKEAAGKFAIACNSISLRCVPASIITIIMIIITFSYEAGLIIPFGIGHSRAGTTGMLLIGLLLVMILCADIVFRGIMSIIKLAPNAETLILLSCVFSFISAVFTMLSDAPYILPYCAVSALTLSFAAYGEKFNLRAITDTLKTAAGSSNPYGVQAEYNEDIDKSVLKKANNRTDGFYNNLMHPDISELVYRYATPVIVGAALLLSLLTLIFRGGNGHFLHSLSAVFAAAAPFSLLLTFSIPFGTVAKSIRRSGAAIAGWGGADDICFTDGASVTDEDIFPPGTMSLSGMKLFDGASPEKAIRYTSSLIAASGSGLSGLFEEVLKSQAMNLIRVEDFACYEGGISALVRGERVATGSAAFMNLLGIRVPDDTNIKSAVYTSVNNMLIAMFTVDYTPTNSVQSALISMMKWRIKLFFAVRDFNITPLMLEQKFRVSLDGVEYIQAKDSYTLSDFDSGKQGRMAAILTREGLGPFAEAITGGRLLKSAAFVATAVSVASAALGVLIMFYMYWVGSVVSAKPGNLLLFMLSMLAAVLVVCGYVKCKK